MRANQAEEKAFQKVKDFVNKTDKKEAFWEMLFEDVKRRKRLIELDEVKREFNNG